MLRYDYSTCITLLSSTGCKSKWEAGLAVMLAANKSAGVALRGESEEPITKHANKGIQPDFEKPGHTSLEVQNRPTKKQQSKQISDKIFC